MSAISLRPFSSRDFSSFATADTLSSDYSATINRRDRVMTASQNVKNFPLKSMDSIYGMEQLSASALNSLSYSVNSDGYVRYYSLPYTTANAVVQPLASGIVSLNPFGVSIVQGVAQLTPPMDNWVDNTKEPSLLIVFYCQSLYISMARAFSSGNSIRLLKAFNRIMCASLGFSSL